MMALLTAFGIINGMVLGMVLGIEFMRQYHRYPNGEWKERYKTGARKGLQIPYDEWLKIRDTFPA